MDVLDSLSDDQRAVLQQFQSITNTEDLDTAVVVLQSTEWDLQTAITKIYDRPSRPPATSADDDDDGDDEDRPLMHDFGIDDSDVMPPSGAGRGPGGSGPAYWLKQLLAIPIHILSWPLGIFYGTAGVVFGLIARLLRIRPGLPSLRPRNPFLRDPNSRRRLLDPIAASERWVRALEELTGLHPPAPSSSGSEPGGSGLRQRGRTAAGLPEFFVGGYEDALRRAKDELRVLMVVLTCEEHDDDADFKRNVLTDPDLLRAISSERVLCWGGDIRDRDAYQVSRTLHPYAYPFVAFISLQPSPRPNSSPVMAALTRHEGPPATSTSSHTLLAALTTLVLPRSTPFLTRLRAQDAARKAERRIRDEQDRAFALAAAKDTERVLRKRKEEEERLKALRQGEENDRERKRREDERAAVRRRAGLWRAWQRRLLEREGEATEGKGVRVGVRLGDGRQVVRRFREHDHVERVYAWVECALGERVDGPASSGGASEPDGYVHTYEFRLATTFPRVVLEVDGSAAESALGAKLGQGANLVVEGLEKRRESMGEAGSDDEEDDEEE